jgi:hypothetical protein
MNLVKPSNQDYIDTILSIDPYEKDIWLGIEDNNKRVGLVQLQELTKISYLIHLKIYKE